MLLSIFPSMWKKALNWGCCSLCRLSVHSIQSRGLWLPRASSVPDLCLFAKQYSAICKLFCVTFMQDKVIHFECRAAFPVPSDLPVPRRLEFAAFTVGQWEGFQLVCKTGHSPTKTFSSLIMIYLLCFFILLQKSSRAVYLPRAAEFIQAISFLVSALLFLLLLEVERPKCHEKNYSHNISSIAKTKMYLHFGKYLPF